MRRLSQIARSDLFCAYSFMLDEGEYLENEAALAKYNTGDDADGLYQYWMQLQKNISDVRASMAACACVRVYSDCGADAEARRRVAA